jgi:hypothetical protein
VSQTGKRNVGLGVGFRRQEKYKLGKERKMHGKRILETAGGGRGGEGRGAAGWGSF